MAMHKRKTLADDSVRSRRKENGRPATRRHAPLTHDEEAERKAFNNPDSDGRTRQDAPVLTSEKPHKDQSEAV